MHRKGAKLIGSLRPGTVCHKAPLALQEKGVLMIAVHPDEQPQLVTPWGIKPLVFVPEPDEGQRATAASHSISTGTKREAP